jgi:hypothetical protein
MLRIFGLDGSADLDDGGIRWQGIDIPDISKPFVYAASRIRDSVRSRAIAKQDLSEAVVNSIITGDRPPKQEDVMSQQPFPTPRSSLSSNRTCEACQSRTQSPLITLSLPTVFAMYTCGTQACISRIEPTRPLWSALSTLGCMSNASRKKRSPAKRLKPSRSASASKLS